MPWTLRDPSREMAFLRKSLHYLDMAASEFADLNDRIDALLRGDESDLAAYFVPVGDIQSVPNARAKVHCKLVALDSRALPRTKDLVRLLANRIIDFAIPRGELRKAQERDLRENTSAHVAGLRKRAEKLFVSAATTGEGGELLLYMLVQTFLRLPQLFCKMPLKTNPEVHVHGIDGIHVGVDRETGRLALYWGESKLYKDFRQALRACLTDIKPFLCSEGGSDSPFERDLQLVRDGLDLADDALNDAILRFLNPDDPLYRSVDFRGVCLVGFDHACYPKAQGEKEADAVLADATAEVETWVKGVGELLVEATPLERVQLEFFLLPFPSVQDFRDAFLKEIGHG